MNVPPAAFFDLISIGDELEAAIREIRDSNRIVDLVCDYCKAEFRGWNENQLYCSRRCQGKAVWEKRCQKNAGLYLQANPAQNLQR